MAPIAPVPVPLTPVESSNIAAIGYETTEHRLFVQFTSGLMYGYENVTSGDFSAFLEADSKGKHFAEYFKNSEAHPCAKLGKMPLPDDAPATPEPEPETPAKDIRAGSTYFLRCGQCQEMYIAASGISLITGKTTAYWTRPAARRKPKTPCQHPSSAVERYDGDTWVPVPIKAEIS